MVQTDIKHPLFSIIIPTLNEEKYLPLLLRDLAEQQIKDFEVVIVDGHSEDKTLQIIEPFKTKIDLSIYDSKKRDLCAQRNLGARLARGEYVIFLDADSRVHKTFIRQLRKEVAKSKHLMYLPTLIPEGGIYADAVLFQFVNFFVEFSQTFGRPIPTGGVMIFNRTYFHILGGYRERRYNKTFFPEDHEIILRASENGVRAKYLRNVRVNFSLRRITKEGRLHAYRKYLISAVQMSLKGKVDQKMFTYEMGGHLYKDIKSKKIKINFYNDPINSVIRQLKDVFNSLLKE